MSHNQVGMGVQNAAALPTAELKMNNFFKKVRKKKKRRCPPLIICLTFVGFIVCAIALGRYLVLN
jgi:hypothetical protein